MNIMLGGATGLINVITLFPMTFSMFDDNRLHR